MCQKLLLRILCFCLAAFIYIPMAFCQNAGATANKKDSSLNVQTRENIFPAITPENFATPVNKVIDSNANAVVLANVGSVEFIGNKFDYLSFVYRKKTRIKILNKKAFDLATIKISLHGKDEDQDLLTDFHASTYNLADGRIKETTLSDKDLLDTRVSKSHDEKSFTMPDLKEGSIIEYTYTITSINFVDIPGWHFQYINYPVLFSEFNLAVPDLFRYLMIRYGIDSFATTNSLDSYEHLHTAHYNIGTNVHHHTWIMEDLPQFKFEDYINNAYNYLDRIEFTLAQISNGRQVVGTMSKDWKTARKDLSRDADFGHAILKENADNLHKTVKKIIGDNSDALSAARQIYYYVRNNFKCTPNDDISIQKDLYDVNKTHKGSVAELNLLLTALFRQIDLNADPVILTTQSFGHFPETYPVLGNINYVICRLVIYKDTLYLDASDPTMGFGKIPLECYNGLAEVIDPNNYNDSVFLYPSQIKDPGITSVVLVYNDSTKSESGSFESLLGYYESADLRKSVAENNGKDKLLKEIKKDYGPDVSINNLQLDSLNQPDQPIKTKFDIDYKNGFDDDVIYFSPVLDNDYRKNPFNSTDKRIYPVELTYPIDETYDFTMDIPNGYTVDELPKSVHVDFNGTDGSFLYQITKDEYTVQLHMVIQIHQTFFPPEAYSSLRDFFNMIIKKENEQVVFKKKK